MKRCEQEVEVRRAMRDGGMSDESHAELRAHAEGCVDCAQAMKLASLLQQDATTLAQRAGLPSAGQLLQRAANRRKEAALARIAVVFRTLRVVGVVYALIVAGWLLHLLSRFGVGSAGLGSAVPHLDSSTMTYVAGGLVTLSVCIASGVWFTLRDERVTG